MKKIDDLTGNAKEFATACYDNSVAELEEALSGMPDETDCKIWNISGSEWQEAIEAALREKRFE